MSTGASAPAELGAELRVDVHTGSSTYVVGSRQDRPNLPETTCPFCPGNELMTPPEILSFREPDSESNSPGWWVRVVPNKYPALGIEGELDRTGFGIYDMMIGGHACSEGLTVLTNNLREFQRMPGLRLEN